MYLAVKITANKKVNPTVTTTEKCGGIHLATNTLATEAHIDDVSEYTLNQDSLTLICCYILL